MMGALGVNGPRQGVDRAPTSTLNWVWWADRTAQSAAVAMAETPRMV